MCLTKVSICRIIKKDIGSICKLVRIEDRIYTGLNGMHEGLRDLGIEAPVKYAAL